MSIQNFFKSMMPASTRRVAARRPHSSKRSSYRPVLECLEERTLLTAYVFVDFGDNFPGGTSRVLTTTVGAIRDVAAAQRDNNNPIPNTVIQGPQLTFDAVPGIPFSNRYADTTAVNFTPFDNSAANRATLLANARRAFASVDVTVVGLTVTAQTLADGRVVAGAANMAGVTATLRGNNTITKDVYVIFATPAIGPNNDNPINFFFGGYGGISPTGTVQGETTDLSAASNSHDDLVLSFRNDANTIVHEAGHALGLQHGVTTAAPANSAINNLLPRSEVMSYMASSNETSIFFSRYPMVRGDGNTSNNDLLARRGQQTPFDQLRVDPNVGQRRNQHYISGTGANDIIRITKGAGSTADVTVSAFNDTKYKKPIIVPGSFFIPITIYSYTVNLDRPLLIQAGLGDDQIILDGDLDRQITVDGGEGTDTDSVIVDDGSDFATFRYTVTNSTVTRNTGFELTYHNIDELKLVTGPNTASPSTVNVESTAAATPVSITTGSGKINVNVGKAGSVRAIRGDVTIFPTATGKAALNVNASADNAILHDTVVVTNREITGLAPATIAYSRHRLSALTISTGFNGNTITVTSTPSAPVTLNTGIDRDVVNVRATNGPLTVNGQSGADAVQVGLAGSVQGIGGPLTVTNSVGYSAVNVDDSANTLARTVILYNNGSSTVISGLAPGGDINLGRFDLSSLTISAGSGGNTFRIHDTLLGFFDDGESIRPTLTSVNTGAGPDNVTVGGTTGALALDVQGAPQGANLITIGSPTGGLNPISGGIDITGRRSVVNSLSINDAASTVSRDYVLGANFVQRFDKARIGYENMSSLSLQAGAKKDNIVVQDTMQVGPGRSTTIAQSGGDDVIDVSRTTGTLIINAGGYSKINIGNATSSLDNIQGAISVVPSGAELVTLTLHDQAATTPQQLDVAAFGLGTFFRRSGAADIFALYNPLVSFFWFGGSGGNIVNVKAQPAALSIFTLGGGGDVVNVGTAADKLFDNGVLSVIGGAGTDQVLIRDQGTTSPRRYNLGVSQAGGSESLGAITARPLDSVANVMQVRYEHVESVTLNAGSGGNLFKITGTPAATSLILHTGTGPDTVDVGSNAVYLDEVLVRPANLLVDIRGPLTLDGQGGQDQVTFNDQGTRTLENFSLTVDQLRRVEATGFFDDMAPVSFPGFEAITLNVGSGGSTVVVYGSAAGSTVTVNGYAGSGDQFAVDASSNAILGPIFLNGQSDGDFAQYYDFGNTAAHTYTLTSTSVNRDNQAPVFTNVGTILYSPMVGGNTVNVNSVALGGSYKIQAATGDHVTVGSLAPGLGGTLADILAQVVVVSYTSDDVVSVIFDDSGNTDTTAKQITFSGFDADGNISLLGLRPIALSWNLPLASSVTVLGGAADETFSITPVVAVTPLRIDGGGGVNTLDYSGDAESTTLPGLVSRYKGEGDFTDAVGGIDGTPQNGVTFAQGQVGQAFSFDGVDDYVEIPDSPNQTPDSISIEAWVNPDTIAGYQVILSKYQSSEPGNYSWVFSNSGGRIEFGVYQGDTGRVIQTIDPVLTAGAWQHVAGTFDLATGVMTIYVDGVAIDSAFLSGHDVPITAINDSTSPVRIGALVNADGVVSNYWDGRIDEPSLYSRALNAAEIQALAAGGTGNAIGIVVNIPLGTASWLTGGIARIQNVVGSAGNDILVGNGGNVLSGSAGRDLLIAGAYASILNGGDDEDLLIGGTTDYDRNAAALMAIMAEWARTDADYATRVANLRNGTNGVPILNATTVYSNGGGNTLNGNAGLDLFFANLDLDALDRDPLTEELLAL